MNWHLHALIGKCASKNTWALCYSVSVNKAFVLFCSFQLKVAVFPSNSVPEFKAASKHLAVVGHHSRAGLLAAAFNVPYLITAAFFKCPLYGRKTAIAGRWKTLWTDVLFHPV